MDSPVLIGGLIVVMVAIVVFAVLIPGQMRKYYNDAKAQPDVPNDLKLDTDQRPSTMTDAEKIVGVQEDRVKTVGEAPTDDRRG